MSKIVRYEIDGSSTFLDCVACDFGESITDKSKFKPDSQDIRDRLIAQNLSSAGVGVYDFKDGKIPDFVDSNYFSAVLALKRKDLDITEVEQIRAKLAVDVKTNVDNDKFNAIMKDIEAKSKENADNVSGDSSSATGDSSN